MGGDLLSFSSSSPTKEIKSRATNARSIPRLKKGSARLGNTSFWTDTNRPKRSCAPTDLTQKLIRLPDDSEEEQDMRPPKDGRGSKSKTVKALTSITTDSPFSTPSSVSSSAPLTPPSEPDSEPEDILSAYRGMDKKGRKRKLSDVSDATPPSAKRQAFELKDAAQPSRSQISPAELSDIDIMKAQIMSFSEPLAERIKTVDGHEERISDLEIHRTQLCDTLATQVRYLKANVPENGFHRLQTQVDGNGTLLQQHVEDLKAVHVLDKHVLDLSTTSKSMQHDIRALKLNLIGKMSMEKTRTLVANEVNRHFGEKNIQFSKRFKDYEKMAAEQIETSVNTACKDLYTLSKGHATTPTVDKLADDVRRTETDIKKLQDLTAGYESCKKIVERASCSYLDGTSASAQRNVDDLKTLYEALRDIVMKPVDEASNKSTEVPQKANLVSSNVTLYGVANKVFELVTKYAEIKKLRDDTDATQKEMAALKARVEESDKTIRKLTDENKAMVSSNASLEKQVINCERNFDNFTARMEQRFLALEYPSEEQTTQKEVDSRNIPIDGAASLDARVSALESVPAPQVVDIEKELEARLGNVIETVTDDVMKADDVRLRTTLQELRESNHALETRIADNIAECTSKLAEAWRKICNETIDTTKDLMKKEVDILKKDVKADLETLEKRIADEELVVYESGPNHVPDNKDGGKYQEQGRTTSSVLRTPSMFANTNIGDFIPVPYEELSHVVGMLRSQFDAERTKREDIEVGARNLRRNFEDLKDKVPGMISNLKVNLEAKITKVQDAAAKQVNDLHKKTVMIFGHAKEASDKRCDQNTTNTTAALRSELNVETMKTIQTQLRQFGVLPLTSPQLSPTMRNNNAAAQIQNSSLTFGNTIGQTPHISMPTPGQSPPTSMSVPTQTSHGPGMQTARPQQVKSPAKRHRSGTWTANPIQTANMVAAPMQITLEQHKMLINQDQQRLQKQYEAQKLSLQSKMHQVLQEEERQRLLQQQKQQKQQKQQQQQQQDPNRRCSIHTEMSIGQAQAQAQLQLQAQLQTQPMLPQRQPEQQPQPQPQARTILLPQQQQQQHMQPQMQLRPPTNGLPPRLPSLDHLIALPDHLPQSTARLYAQPGPSNTHRAPHGH
ncbi:hypothetical protein K504DRAFT_452862 [Pleomassaria siparia CBS 279.74]|uniref:Uncharacterized protein n=1 Tax=Pleomassaria siparia CBS 279.74 TaxID=1314801 RepID=A0A6G1KIV1_9PLEO|nr:hypothetical protein K504DRAFT_452862 [Pleomassaria siparia CBS 279.74]